MIFKNNIHWYLF